MWGNIYSYSHRSEAEKAVGEKDILLLESICCLATSSTGIDKTSAMYLLLLYDEKVPGPCYTQTSRYQNQMTASFL